jgi:hypothetical protein
MTMKKLTLVLTATACLMKAASADEFDPGPLTTEEKELQRQGAIMEVYQPNDHSGYSVGWIKPVDANGKVIKGKGIKVLVCNFGMEYVQKARAQGREMAGFHCTPVMAQQFLFAQGWDEFHDRFYTRAYVQEGMSGYYGK